MEDVNKLDKLDRFDRHIMRVLQQQGRIANQELAELVGLSPSPCLRRVRALEALGYITGYHAKLNAAQLDLGLTALIQISMDTHTADKFDAFEAAVQHIPEVVECLLITGHSADYQLKVVVKDLAAFQHLLLQKITKIAGVSGVHSSFVLRQLTHSGALPL